jgi:hypothetical protein
LLLLEKIVWNYVLSIFDDRNPNSFKVVCLRKMAELTILRLLSHYLFFDFFVSAFRFFLDIV